MKNKGKIDRIIASMLVFFVVMVVILFTLMPFGETLFVDEITTNLIILGIPACIALLHYFYVTNVGSLSREFLVGEQRVNPIVFILTYLITTKNKPSFSFIVIFCILILLLIFYKFGPSLY